MRIRTKLLFSFVLSGLLGLMLSGLAKADTLTGGISVSAVAGSGNTETVTFTWGEFAQFVLVSNSVNMGVFSGPDEFNTLDPTVSFGPQTCISLINPVTCTYTASYTVTNNGFAGTDTVEAVVDGCAAYSIFGCTADQPLTAFDTVNWTSPPPPPPPPPPPVPEPSTIYMLGTGLLGLLGAMRRKLRA